MRRSNEVIAVEQEFSVVDETENWIVVSKPAPLIVHPTNNYKPEPTLLGGVQALLAYDMANGARLSIVNRLDRETSGLVIIAKNKTWARQFGRAMERRTISKCYQAIAFGWPDWDDYELEAPLLRKGEYEVSPIWVKQMVHEEGKPCRTGFKVVERKVVKGRRVSLLDVEPHTGRMHQIRVHAAHLGFPLVGDKIYGEDEGCYLRFIESGWSDELEQKLLMPRQALHACAMSVEIEGEVLSWRCDLASDLQQFLSLPKE